MKSKVKQELSELQKKFFLHYSKHYGDDLPFLNNYWYYVRILLLTNMKAPPKGATVSDLMIGRQYYFDLVSEYGDFIDT